MLRNSDVPTYRLHRGSGQAIVYINGRDVYLGVHNSPESKAKYQEIVRKVLADRTKSEMERGVRPFVDIKVAELAVKYRSQPENYYTKQGVATSQTAIIKLALKVVLAKFSHLEARLFGPLRLQECLSIMVSHGLTRTENNRRIRLIRKMFCWGVAMELI